MNEILKSLLTAFLIAAAIQCFTVGVIAPHLPREVVRPEVYDARTLSYPKARRVQINNQDGSVSVQVHEQDVAAIEINAAIRAYTQSSATRPLAMQYVASLVKVDASSEAIAVVTEPQERPSGIELRVDYTINVPEGTDISISGSNGNAYIAKGCGDVSVLGNNTDVDVYEPRGVVILKSTNGRIRVYDAKAPTTLQTVNGSIYADMRGGKLMAQTTNGRVVATMLQPEVESCNLTAVNGDITLSIREDITVRVDAKTGRGLVRSDLAVNSDDAVQRSRELHGVLGAGRTRCNLVSTNGDIWVTKLRSTT